MGHTTRFIHGLERKITIIAEVLSDRSSTGRISRKTFAQMAGIEYEALKSAWQRGRLSEKLEFQIASFVGFSANAPEWHDHTFEAQGAGLHRRHDEPEMFRRMLNDLFGLSRIDRRLIESNIPTLIDGNIANFSVDAGNESLSADQHGPLLLTISLEPGYILPDLSYGFTQVRLRLIPPSDSLARFHDQCGFGTAYLMGNAAFRAVGTKHLPVWQLEVYQGAKTLQGEFRTDYQPLCAIGDAELGETFKAELSVRPSSSILESADETELPSKVKQKILKILIAKRLNRDADMGAWITLGEQRFSIVRANK